METVDLIGNAATTFLTECAGKGNCESLTMSKVQTLRAFVNQRLTLAAEEIFELFERTIAEYEEELRRQHKLLDAVFKPEVRLHRADVQQLLVSKEKVTPEQQEWSPLLDQEESPELPHVKEEPEELWSSQEGEQLQGLEEADITKVTFIPVPVKSEDEEKPQFSQLHQTQTEQMKTEADGEEFGGSEPARNFNPDNNLQPAIPEETSHPTEPETYGSCDWEETREPHTGSNPLQNHEEPVSDMKCNTVETPVISSECATNRKRRKKQTGKKEQKCFTCSVCKKAFQRRETLERHMRSHTGERPFSCSVCKKAFRSKGDIVRHMRVHTGEKPFSCPVCGKRFSQNARLTSHLRIHTGENLSSCSICKRSFSDRENLLQHMMTHTEAKPFSCSVCGMKCTGREQLRLHARLHTEEKPFGCSVCGMRFTRKDSLKTHNRIHTGEKPFSCSVCGRRFTQSAHLNTHLRIHTERKPFTCSVCKEGFSSKFFMFHHMKIHTEEKPFSCFLSKV